LALLAPSLHASGELEDRAYKAGTASGPCNPSSPLVLRVASLMLQVIGYIWKEQFILDFDKAVNVVASSALVA
jgi:hypothetical protein